VVSARRSDRGPVFSLATSVAGINGAGNNGTPFLTQDGLTLYFYSDRSGGVGSRDIWQAHRSDASAAWQGLAPVPVINSSSLDHLPTLSADQLTLVFASDRAGLGASDLWIAERSSVSVNFSPPQNLVALNTPVEDSGPSLSSDGLTLYFSSKRPSASTSDIWVATRPDRGSSFGTPVKVDAVNSPGDDLNVTVSPDGLELILSSNRSGAYQLWRSLRSCP
jgi:Tol biopolymer transport system component